ncbi:MAG: gfo/Idh/MocA family oxidoreductase [Alphaproteobacteria bacterium]|nr:gfo/Idh/MocA family oxidoreductase [Alphaproteobacteria bacterium]
MRTINIGLIGAGYIGHSMALAYRAVGALFPDLPPVRLAMLADANEATAAKAAQRYGFAASTGDWRRLVTDKGVDVVAIATPNHLHCEMAVAALEAGKHVHCEKPLALDMDEARKMADAARRAGTRTIVGYNYLHNPMIRLAREIVARGEIGRLVHFRGFHEEDYMSDPALPFSWRCEREFAGAGALADLGSHIVSFADALAGPIAELSADIATVVPERPVAGGGRRKVENEDQGQFIARFASGATGAISASRVATGRKMGLAFELVGTEGAIAFDQERLNELRVYRAKEAAGARGFATILAGPEHPGYAAFCPAPGHQIGFTDLKTLEVAHFLSAICNGRAAEPDFATALRYEAVIDAALRSAESRRWVRVGG